MSTPVFGFSVGDFVTVATLIWKLCKALSDASEDSKVFRDVQVELFAFNGVVVQLQQSIRNVIALPEGEWLVVKRTLQQTKATVEEFGRHISTFKADPSDSEGTQAIVNWKKRVLWSFTGGKKIKSFRESMQSYSAILTLTLQSFNKFVLYPHRQRVMQSKSCFSLAVQNLDQRLTTEARDLSLQLQRNTDDIRSQVNRVIEEPWDQKPIRFQDAIGRRYPLPLEVCRTLEVHYFAYSNSTRKTRTDEVIGSFGLFKTFIQRHPNSRCYQAEIDLVI